MTLPTAQEYADRILPKPRIEEGRHGRLTFKWERSGTTAVISNLERRQGSMTCEIIIRSDLFGPGVAPRRINLLSSSAMTGYIRELNDRFGDSDDWKRVMDHVGTMCWERMERGTPGEWISYNPTTRNEEMLVSPMVASKELGLLSADGGVGKTTLMTALALAFKTGEQIIPGFVSTHTGEALYLDWESDRDKHEAIVSGILKGAGLEANDVKLRYMRCRGPIGDQIDNIRREAEDYRAEIVIIDSVSWAAGGDLMAQETVDKYEKAVSMLDATTIGICHTPKAGEQEKPFGSAFWHDLARSSWVARQTQEEGDDRIHVGLWHRKANYRRRQPPVGVRIEFTDGAIRFGREDVTTNFEAQMTLRQQIRQILGDGIKRTPKEISEELEVPAPNIRSELSRGRKLFDRDLNGKWFLLREEAQPLRDALHPTVAQQRTPKGVLVVADEKVVGRPQEEEEEPW